MAYANLVLQSCSNKIEYFCRMRDFICKRNGTYDYSTTGIGWTLHDSSYAVDEDNPAINDWIVLKGIGESTDEDMYFKITWVSGYIKIQGYLYWNNSTHAGVNPTYNTGNNLTIAETGSYELSVYGDLDFVSIIESLNHATYDYMVFFGKMANLIHDDTVATSSGAESAGSNVVITLDAVPSDWAATDRVYVRDNAHVEIVTIENISGNDVTVDLVNSYAAGFKMQKDMGYVCNNSATTLAAHAIVGHNTVTALILASSNAVFGTNVDPDELNDLWIGTVCYLTGTDTYYGTFPNIIILGSGGLVGKDLLTGDTDYRYFKYYTTLHMGFKEV